MKKLIFIIYALFCFHLSFTQIPFLFTFEQPNLEILCDAIYYQNNYYLIHNTRINPGENSWEYDVNSQLWVLDNEGHLTDTIQLGKINENYLRFLSIKNDNLFLAGVLRGDTCQSTIIFSKYNLENHALIPISSTPLCDRRVTNFTFFKGIGNDFFMDEFHSWNPPSLRKTFFTIDSSYHLKTVFDSLTFDIRMSIDFSRKGYVQCVTGVYWFYDRDFNYRKVRYTNESFKTYQETHLPFGKHWIIEQTANQKMPENIPGLRIRVIDSTLTVKKSVLILPDFHLSWDIQFPIFDGLDIQNENEIWSAAYYYNYLFQSPYFSVITKLDSNLNILCQQFFGSESLHVIYELRAFPEGGAIVVGKKVREGLDINGGEDVFALRIGENCEMPPITAVENDPGITSITAYPNPSINSLTFDVQGFDPADLSVEIIDANGKICFTASDLSFEIHVDNLPPGQYFYRIWQKKQLCGVGAWTKI